MNLGDLVPWGRKDRGLAPQDRGPGSSELRPFVKLHHEMNRLFEDVFRDFEAPALLGRPWPSLEVEETDDGYRVTAELPGMDEKDIDVSFEDGVLRISGERQTETRNRDRTVSERYYGRFKRRLSLGELDEEKITASFDNGVLTIIAPKSPKAEAQAKRVPISTGQTVH